MNICKHCKLVKNTHSFKITNFNKFKLDYLKNPSILHEIDKNGFTFFQNILWSFSRERFVHSNKVLFEESKKSLNFLLSSIPVDDLYNILTLESKNVENFTVLHDYAKNLLSVKSMDWEFIDKLKKLGLTDLLNKKDNDGLSTLNYLNKNTVPKDIVRKNQEDIKNIERYIISLISPDKCNICGNHINLLDYIKEYNFSKFKENKILIQKINILIKLRKNMQSIYGCIKKDDDGHSYVISLWQEKLLQMI